ncbi:unnamed protein product [Ixodes hexagonus]
MAAFVNVTSPPMVTFTVRVGNYSADHYKSPLCVVFRGTLVTNRVLYLRCSQVLHGLYVVVHVRSPNPLSVCDLVTYSVSVPAPSQGKEEPYGVQGLIGACFGLAFVVVACCLLLETAKVVLRRETFRAGSYESL